MADMMKRERALQVYSTVCATLDARQWKYDRDDEKLIIRFAVRTRDLPVYYVLIIDEDRQMLRLASPMDFKMEPTKRTEGAIITTVATRYLRDGNFDYDIQTGNIAFRLTSSFRGCTVGQGMVEYFIDWTDAAVDHFNDRFAAVNKGEMSVAEFIACAGQ